MLVYYVGGGGDIVVPVVVEKFGTKRQFLHFPSNGNKEVESGASKWRIVVSWVGESLNYEIGSWGL